MRGIVFKYGVHGDPLLRPDIGGKIVVLVGYSEKPKIGSMVEYEIIERKDHFDYGGLVQTRVQKPLPEIRRLHEPVGDSLEGSLEDIQGFWDRVFAEYMTEKARV